MSMNLPNLSGGVTRQSGMVRVSDKIGSQGYQYGPTSSFENSLQSRSVFSGFSPDIFLGYNKRCCGLDPWGRLICRDFKVPFLSFQRCQCAPIQFGPALWCTPLEFRFQI